MAERRIVIKNDTEQLIFQNVSKLNLPKPPEDEWQTEEYLFNSGVVVAKTNFTAYGVKGHIYVYSIKPSEDLETPLGDVTYEVKAGGGKLWIAQVPLSFAVIVEPQPLKYLKTAYDTFLRINLDNTSYRLDLLPLDLSQDELAYYARKISFRNDSITHEREGQQGDVDVAIPGLLNPVTQVRASFINNEIHKSLSET